MRINKNKIIETARKYTLKGQIDKAIKEWQKIAADSTGDGSVHNTIGDLHLKTGNTEDAITAFKQAADIFKETGFILKTIAVYKKIIKLDSSLIDIYLQLGDLNAERDLKTNAVENYLAAISFYSKANNTKESIHVYKKIINMDPDNLKIRFQFSEMCLNEGLHLEATDEYINIAQKFMDMSQPEKAEKMYDKILSYDKDNERVLSFRKAMVSEAISTTDDKEVDESDRISTLQARGQKYYAKEEWDKAEAIFEQLVKEEPEQNIHYEKLGYVYLNNKRPSDALEVFLHVIEDYMLTGNFQKIITISSDLLAQNPEEMSIREILAKGLANNGEPEKAFEEYKLLLEHYVNGNNKQEWRSLLAGIHEMPDEMLLRLRELVPDDSSLDEESEADKSSDDFDLEFDLETEEAQTDKSKSTMASDDVSEGLASESDSSSAEEDEPAPVGSKEDIPNYFTEADVYIKYGLATKAIEQMELVLSVDPQNIDAYRKIIDINKTEGLIDKAITHCLTLKKIYKSTGLSVEEIDAEIAQIDPDGTYTDMLQDDTPVIHVDMFADAISVEKNGEIDKLISGLDMVQDDETDQDEEDSVAVYELDTDEDYSINVDNHAQKNEQDKGALSPELEAMVDEADFYASQGLTNEAINLYEKILVQVPGDSRIRTNLETIKAGSKSDEGIATSKQHTDFDDLIYESYSTDLDDEPTQPDTEQPVQPSKAADDTPAAKEQQFPDEEFPTELAELNDNIDDIDKYVESEEVAATAGTGSKQKASDISDIEEEFYDLANFLDEELTESQENQGKTQSNSILNENKELLSVFNEFKKGVEKNFDAEDFETHYDLGIAYKEMGLLSEAVDEFNLSSKSPERVVDSLIMSAECHKMLGDIENAILQLETLMDKFPDELEKTVWARYDLAELYEQAGNSQKAYTLYLKVFNIDVNIKDVAKKVANLKKNFPGIGEDSTPKSKISYI